MNAPQRRFRFPALSRTASPPFFKQLFISSGLLLLGLSLSPAASAQLEQFGIRNGNNAAGASQQERLETLQNQISQQEGDLGCTDPDPSKCVGTNPGAGFGNINARGQEFNFDQPYQGSYYDRLQPRYRFQPENPTQFQRYVAEVTGLWLPIFGADLFGPGVSTFAPVLNAPVPSNYVIGPGDELFVQATGQINFDLHLTVDRNGQVGIPRVGPVRVAGLTYGQTQDALKRAVGKDFRNFDLSVSIGQLRSVTVYLTGEARRPGSYTVSSLSTLVNALFASGGPSADGSMRHIELRRNGQVVTTFDLYDLLLHGDKSKDAALLPEDVIYIPPAGSRVAIFGSVNHTAIFELRNDPDVPAQVEQLVTLAGGMTSTAGKRHAELERTEDGARHVVEVPLDRAGMTAKLEDGDILRIYSMVPRFDNAITLRGNVATPGRFAWHDGMTLKDLIPDRESLLTRDYWRTRAQLGLPVLEFTPVPVINPNAGTRQRYEQRVVSGNAEQEEMSLRAQAEQGVIVQPRDNFSAPGTSSQESAQYPNGNNGAQFVNQNSGQMQNNTSSGTIPAPNTSNAQPLSAGSIPTDNSQAVTGGDAENSTRANGLTNRYNPSSVGPQDRSTGLRTAGNATAAGYAPPLPQNFPAKNLVELPAAEIDWSYAVIERLDKNTLKTSLLPFDLGRLVMDGDMSQNLPLQPGDVVTIFSEADLRVPRQQQTRLVRLEGEVKNAGVYSVRPGETLRQLVARAGGLTPDAYLYGSSFTRESVKQQQQQRLDEYVVELASDLDHARAQSAANAAEAGGGAGLDDGANRAEQQTLANLRQLRAAGRIVLNIAPEDREISALPDLPLEDGDHLVVPSLPSSVNVVGSVYNQNSFLFASGSRAGEYLKQAGGANRIGDSRHEFIVRADGSVVSRTNEALLSNFDGMPIYPGDTLVVPQKLVHPSALRYFIEVAPLFSSIALTAATIALVH